MSNIEPRNSPSYRGLSPASARASKAARGASRKAGTGCELLLRGSLRRLGLRFSINARTLPGCPDIIFRRERLVVFCDGDFWHGRSLARRIRKLEGGHNAAYWVAKVQTNTARDRRHRLALHKEGW